MRLTGVLLTGWVGCFLVAAPALARDWAELRDRMVAEIEEDVAATRRQIGVGSLRPEVMRAMAMVPRHEFVPLSVQAHAYQNRPLPIGHGQTISQPYIVALMSDLTAVADECRVLEVGTGSGYQAAILAAMGCHVFTIEIIPELGEAAAERLQILGYSQVRTRVGDGYFGWEEEGPFDAIVVTAAASHIPPPLVQQIAPGGRMVLPVGNPFHTQQLTVVEKSLDGSVRLRQLLPVIFVPLTGGH